MKLITASEAAARLMISPSTLAQYRCSGNGPEFYKLGRRVFYSEECIERWIRDRLFKSTADMAERKP